MTSWSAGTVEVAGGRLAYHRTGGGGPVVVLSHGLTDNGLCWTRLAQALEAEFDLVMLDARGHGESSRMPTDGSHDPGRDIAEAIQGLGLERPIVMGHSVGARATAAYAAAHPDRVAKVVLEDPPFLLLLDAEATAKRRDGFRRHVAKLQAMSLAELVAMGRETSPSWHEDDFPAWAQAKTQVDPEAMPVYATPWQEQVAGIVAPTLLVHGDPTRDSLVTPEIRAEVKALIPGIETVMVANAGHNTRRENFTDYVAAVRRFLLA